MDFDTYFDWNPICPCQTYLGSRGINRPASTVNGFFIEKKESRVHCSVCHLYHQIECDLCGIL